MPVIKLTIYNQSNNKTKKKKMQSMNVAARKRSFTIPICSGYLHKNFKMHSHTDIYTSSSHLLDCFEGYQIEIWTCRNLGNWPIGYRI